jgi:glutathione S-transferase
VLVDGGLVLYESAAICLHLADRHAAAGLAPAPGSNERAQFYKWLIYLTNTVQAELLLYFYPERLADDAAAAAQIKAHAESRTGDMLDLIEAALAAGPGPFLLGATYRAVDAYLLMLCRWTRNLRHPARARPHLARLLDAVMARPATQRAFAAEGIAAPFY